MSMETKWAVLEPLSGTAEDYHRPSLATFLYVGQCHHHLLHGDSVKEFTNARTYDSSWGPGRRVRAAWSCEADSPDLGKKGASGRQSSHGTCSGVTWKETEKHGIRILGLETQAVSCEDWAAWDWGPSMRGYSTAACQASRYPCQQSTPQILKIKQINSELYSTQFTLELLIYFWNQIVFQKSTRLNNLGKGLWMCPHFTITMN